MASWLFARARRRLERLVSAHRVPGMLGDLHEDFVRRRQTVGRMRAMWWLWRESRSLERAYAQPPALRLLPGLVDDLRLAGRSLTRTPGFSATAVVVFALGIGVNLSVLAIIDRMVLRPLPYGDAEELVHIHNRRASVGPLQASFLNNVVIGAIKARSRAVEDIAVVDGRINPSQVSGLAAPLRLDLASWNLLSVLKVRPQVGRDFVPSDLDGSELVVLLTEEAWARRFGRSSTVFGESLSPGLAGTRPFRIVGILPPDFLVPASAYGERSEGILLDHKERLREDFANNLTRASAMARLKPGVTLSQAQADVDAVVAQILPLIRNQPDEVRGAVRPASEVLRERRVQVTPLRSGLFYAYQSYGSLIGLGVFVVFLMACVNLSMLFLARGRAREQESAIRSALGASRPRILRTAIVEASVLCLVSAGVAVAACYSTSDLLLTLVPVGLRGLAVSPVDGRLLAITVTASLCAAAVAGGWPALRATRVDLTVRLRADSRSVAGRLRGSATLLAAEAALGLVLVAGAIVSIQNILILVYRDPGYRAADLYDLEVAPGSDAPPHTPMSLQGRANAVIAALERTPGLVSLSPYSGLQFPLGREPAAADVFWKGMGASRGRVTGVGPGYFATLDSQMVAGREFLADDLTPQPTAVLNVRGVQHLWPDLRGPALADAIGRQVITDDGPYVVVGVVQNQQPSPGAAAVPELFVPYTSPLRLPGGAGRRLRFALRMSPGVPPNAADFDTRIERALGGHGPEPSISAIADSLQPHLQKPRFLALLFGSVGAIALLLAAVGLYALTSFDVSRRRAEVAIRVSLGATPSHVRALLFRQALRPVLIGATAGLLVTVWGTGLVRSIVHSEATSIVVFVVIIGVFATTSAIAAWVAARRAATGAPSDLLRSNCSLCD